MATTDGWMPLAEFCEKYKQRANTIHKRVTDGAWERGVMYSAPDGSSCFVHEERAVAWLREKGQLPPIEA